MSLETRPKNREETPAWIGFANWKAKVNVTKVGPGGSEGSGSSSDLDVGDCE